MASIDFLKGHGTENDFVLIPDGAAVIDLDARDIAAICDRRAGVGADGVLRAVLSAHHRDAAHLASDAPWFMDYRNADGSIAEMCGNGARVFARYLVAAGLVAPGAFSIATRAGLVETDTPRSGDVRVRIGPYALPDTPEIEVQIADQQWPATAVTMPNPHAVALVADLADVGDLVIAPIVTPATAFPAGVNVELVQRLGRHRVAMRVYERGVGETRSCGTGVAAVAVAIAAADGALGGDDDVSYEVRVPGGTLVTTIRPDGRVDLVGPAVIVAAGTIDLDALSRH